MAKVRFALFEKVTGSVGKTITFRKLPNKAKQILQQKPVPSYTRTQKQNNVRTGYKRLCELWKTADWIDKTVYANFADIYKITPFNAFLKFNLPIMSRKPVLYLSLDEGSGSTTHDYSEFENNGEIIGATWQKLKNGKNVLYFDGVDDYVEVYPFTGELYEITAIVWIKTNDTLNHGTPLSCANPDRFNEFLIYNYKDITIYIRDKLVIDSNIAVNDGEWHQIVVTWRASDGLTKLYIDGQLKRTGSGTTNTIDLQNVVIGQEQDSFRGNFDRSQAYLGEIANVAIFNKALTEKQIRKIYETTKELFKE